MRTSFVSHALTLAVLATALAGCRQAQEQPRLAGQDVRVTVLHTSDIHSRLLPYYQVPGLVDRGLGLCVELQPFGGASRMAHLIKRERARANRVMHLDSGDYFQGAPIFNRFLGEVEMKVMSALSPEGVVIGNHEFDLGAANVATQYDRFGRNVFPLLAANYLFNETSDVNRTGLGSMVKPYDIVNMDGLRVAIIGMGNTSSLSSIAQGGNSLGITPLEPVEALRALVETLHSQVDLIFVVSHQGLTSRGAANLAEDQEMVTGYTRIVPKDGVHENWEILNEQPNGEVEVRIPGIVGIDAIFGGHLHIVLNPPKVVVDPAGRPVLLVHSGAFAKFFGRADLLVRVPGEGEDARFGSEIVSHSYSLFPITNRVPKKQRDAVVACPEDGTPTTEVEAGDDEIGARTVCKDVASGEDQIIACEAADACRRAGDACTDECRSARRRCESVPAPLDGAMVDLLDPYVQELYQNEDLNRGFAIATERITRFGLSGEDSPLGNLVADSMRFRNRVEAQFSMTNTLGIRTNMERGLVTIEAMFNIFPFENSLTTIFLSGTEVQELFDFVTERSAERGCQTQAQLSGVSFTMNCAQALRNLNGPPCHSNEECESSEFAKIGTNKPARCVQNRCVKSPADDILINGEPVNPTESYKAAVNDFIGRGGSGFEVLRRNTTKVNTNLSLRDALIDYMRLDPAQGGPGRVCGSRVMVDPKPPARPWVRLDRTAHPEASCSDRPPGCTAGTGLYFDCRESATSVDFYCTPFDFGGGRADDQCAEIARITPPFEVLTGAEGESACSLRPGRTCEGQLHCCERALGDGRTEATFYCVGPLCVDPPETGRIRRVVQ